MPVFAKAGPANTEESLKIAFETAERHKISHLIVASTYGDTARLAHRMLANRDVQLVIVTHNTGFKVPGEQQFDPALRAELEQAGVRVVTSTMPFRTISRAVRDRFGYSDTDLVANTLRIFCEGVKVCVEIACMACDAGAAPPVDVVAVAGTGRGADTVAVVKAQPSHRFFDVRVREIVVKPWEF